MIDFLKNNGCVVNLSRGTLHYGNIQVKLRDESSWEVHRASLAELFTIQPDRKVDLVWWDERANLEGVQEIIELMGKFSKKFPIAMASTFSLVNNDRSQSVTIYKDTSVGEFCPDFKKKGQKIPRTCYYRLLTTFDDSDKQNAECILS